MPRYATIRVPVTHPLASKNASYQPGPGTVQMWKHRYVLFAKIGYGPHWCHWCGKNVNWQPGKRGGGGRCLVVDHVDDDRTNNDPANLVASCTGCNVHRAHPFALVGDDELYVTINGKRNRAEERTCRTCGAAFLVTITHLNSSARRGKTVGIYCSRDCMYDRHVST